MGQLERGRARLILALGALLAAVLISTSALAAPPADGPPTLAVEVIPTAVTVPPRGEVEALVVARNPLTDTLRGVRLSWFTDAEVTVRAEAPPVDELSPYGALTWRLFLAQAGQEPAAGALHLRVDYLWTSEEGQVSLVSSADLSLSARPPATVAQVAQVRVETALESLMQYRPGQVYLVVTNIADVPVEITRVVPDGPDFVSFDLPDAAGAELLPGESHTIPVRVEATDTVRPGKHLLLFEIGLRWEKGGRAQTGSLVSSQAIDAGVLGETEILTALAVPSFLVLPGVLMMIALGLLWRWARPGVQFPAATSQEFWFFAISASLIIAFLYPAVTAWLGVPRSYLDGYGLRDILWVWLGSIGVIVVGFSLVYTGIRLRTVYYDWKTRESTPAAGDSPVAILRKLERQGLGLVLPRADVLIGGTPQRAYLLQPPSETAPTIWVGPTIVLEWRVERMQAEDRELQQQVDVQLNLGGEVETLAALLEKGLAREVLDVRWKPAPGLAGPYRARREDLQNTALQPTLIIEEE